MIDCPKFAKMHKMFHGKFVTVTKVQLVAKHRQSLQILNVVDVNVRTRSNIIEEQMFKDRKPRKAKSAIEWEKE
jgi:hypothetical protein